MRKTVPPGKVAGRERGATLIVALIFLLIIVVVSMNGIQTTVMEERMASNTRQRNLAFQSAETGLREAEKFINNLTNIDDFGEAAGLLSASNSEPVYFSAATWVDGKSVQVASGAVGNLYGLEEYPRYIIKYLVENNADGISDPEYQNDNSSDKVAVFKIVSRGVGGNKTTSVVLQSNYGKRL
ncbi:pilus assembly PilX family protein [Aliamphritea ceti]|uniref:pilus assembly PilX family protein n=1 Tax=Aliamphritea ceti TaxID=1524258 RepID=UPI0021C267F1|nr:PilX N-terminal domain-containing pilus assembly protein [Aliamphritea ceti]